MVLKDYIEKSTDPIKDSYYKRLAEVESSNNPLAQADTSSAAGLYQFTEGTWKGLTKQLGLDYTLEDRFDPIKSRQVVEEFTNKNKNYLMKKLGREPNEAELYLAHFQGMGGANKLLSSLKNNPNANIDSVVGQNAILANRNVFLNKDGSQKKVKDVYNWAAKKFGVEDYKIKEKEEEEKPYKQTNTNRETTEVKIDNTQVAMPAIKEDMQPAKFNELFRFDNTEAKIPEYVASPQEEYTQPRQQQKPRQLDQSLYNYIQLEELQDGGEKENSIYIDKSDIEGQGVFAKKDFTEGHMIGIGHKNGQPVTELGRKHNHSEKPNSESILIGDARYIKTLRPLKKGEEITVDYRKQPELEQPEDFKK